MFQEDLYGLDHVTGWEPCDLHHLVNASGVGSVLYIHRSGAIHNNASYRIYCMVYYLDYLDGLDRNVFEA